MNPHVSIIIPIHNEAMNLHSTVEKIIKYGERNLMGRYEILLVENGSTDSTLRDANQLQRTFRPVRALCVEGRSKAAAVRAGMLKATGDYRYMCDCDLSTPIDELSKFIKTMREGWDIVIGSREHPDSKVETSFKRWMIGRVFQLLVLQFTGLDYPDTQCGFKLFSARAAQDIFSRVECTSMAFDVETLYLGAQLSYSCKDIPVTWQNDPDSRVRLVADSWSMLRDISRIPKLHKSVKRVYRRKVPA